MTAWILLSVAVVAMLAIDLFVFGHGDHEVTVRESSIWSVVWLVVALAFGGVLLLEGSYSGGEYMAGYLLERSLSLDNLFVFAVLFSYFGVPKITQPRVLVLGDHARARTAADLHPDRRRAARPLPRDVLRVRAAARLHGVEARAARRRKVQAENPVVRAVRKRFPSVKPLVIVFIAVATTDVIFAVDSIPAIFAITTTPFVVFAANAFAMLGLRALYFLLVGVMDRFVYLSQGLAVILGIIGAKMLLIDVWHPPIWLSLVLIVVVLGATAWLSLRADPRKVPAA